jgi:hypothetical protein
VLASCHGNARRRAFRNDTRATTSFCTIPVVIVLSSVISFLDHERDITLAIHVAIPDLIRETNRHVIQAGSGGCLVALARRFEWNSRAKPV